MKFHAVLNRHGGTLKTLDIDAFASRMREKLVAAGHEVEIEIVEGKDVVDALDRASRRRSVDAVIVGGGDGSVSAAAAALMGKKRALGILPAGTINLFARALGMPLDLDDAIAVFAQGKTRQVDIATANGRPFVHQYSVGLHAKMVAIRDEMEFRSRWGKIRASARATWSTLMNPPRMRVTIRADGARITTKTQGIGVSNNLFGEGHLPYADDPAGGVLGLYVTRADRRRDLVRHFANMLIGRWDANPHVDISQAHMIELEFYRVARRHRCVIDGELVPLERKTRIEIHPGALRVVAP